MKQSNIDYKHTYHFKGHDKAKSEDVPSIAHDAPINTTIKENPYRANVEIEKDEIVLRPDFSALHKAGGKKHSQGGTSVLLQPDSFVFSDDKSLAFDKKDHELFELKEGGNFKPQRNTPAKVLERNIDLKHYNKVVSNLSDPKKDEITKRSSELMLSKYFQTIGNIAFVQEGKKDYPQGIPEFSMGTAPVYDTQTKNDIEENKQYAKYGGKISNPYLPKMQLAGFPYIKPTKQQFPVPGLDYSKYNQIYYPANTPYAPTHSGDKLITPNPKTGDKSNTWNRADDEFPTLNTYASAVGYPTDRPMNSSMIQQWVKDTYPDLVAKHHSAPPPGFGMPNAGKEVDDYIGVRWKAIARDIVNRRPFEQKTPPSTQQTNTTNDTLIPGDGNVPVDRGVAVDWQFTPWQKRSQLYNLGKWASAQRYMPYRSRYNATYMDPMLVNPEQAVGDTKAAFNSSLSASRILNPILGGADAQMKYGQGLTAAAAIRSQYDNQNAQIVNQARQYNNQVRNQESMVNMQNDQNYYRESVLGRQNFNNMRNFLMDQYMNNRMRDVETNQTLAYNLLTQDKPAYGFDFRSGNFYRNPKSILDVATDTKSDSYTQVARHLMSKIESGQELTKPEVDFFKALSIGKIPFSPSSMIKKKGGYVNPYKK